ncbi:MAG: hypothetical protein AB2A00_23920 [Myxococcota bacterium]
MSRKLPAVLLALATTVTAPLLPAQEDPGAQPLPPPSETAPAAPAEPASPEAAPPAQPAPTQPPPPSEPAPAAPAPSETAPATEPPPPPPPKRRKLAAKEKKDEGSWTPALFGDPTPLTRRAPTNRNLTFELDVKYGLVGTGPTKFVNDLRFSITDYFELKTQMWTFFFPESLIGRLSVGNYRTLGRFGFEGGLHKADVGLRLFPDVGEERGFNPGIIPSVSLAGALTYDRPIWDRFAMHTSFRIQQRLQHSVKDLFAAKFSDPMDQLAYQLAVQGTWDVTSSLGMTLGLSWAHAVDNQTFKDVAGRAVEGTLPWDDPVAPQLETQAALDRRDPLSALDLRGQCLENRTRTLFIDYAEIGRPGFSSLVDREMNCSLALSGGLTYGRTEAFDVDLFGALRMWPALGGLFGAGIRWRIAP